MLTHSDSINIKTLKGVIAFTGELKQLFDGLIESKYCFCKQVGKTEKEAFKLTLEMIGNKLDKITQKISLSL